MSKILETGENISLSNYGSNFDVSFSNSLAIVGVTNQKSVLRFSQYEPLDLINLQSSGITEILLFSNSAFNSDRAISVDFTLNGRELFRSVESNLDSGITQFGRIYLHNGVEWKYRAMRNLYRTQADFERAFGVKLRENQSTSVSVPRSVAQVTQQPRQAERPRNVIHPNGKDITKMECVELPTDIRNLYLGFGYKSLSNPTGILQKLVTSQGIDVDMDLSLILFSEYGTTETITGTTQRSRDGAVYHYGNKSESNGDSEMISIALHQLDPEIKAIAVVVTSERSKFNLLENSIFRLKNQEGMQPLINFRLQNDEDKASCLVGILNRAKGYWSFQAVESYEKANNPYNLQTVAKNWVDFINR